MMAEPTKSYLPFSWLIMAETKQNFFRGLAHYYIALALVEQKGDDVNSSENLCCEVNDTF